MRTESYNNGNTATQIMDFGFGYGLKIMFEENWDGVKTGLTYRLDAVNREKLVALFCLKPEYSLARVIQLVCGKNLEKRSFYELCTTNDIQVEIVPVYDADVDLMADFDDIMTA